MMNATNAKEAGISMLHVITPEEMLRIISDFSTESPPVDLVSIDEAYGRITAQDIVAGEYVPDFNRSTVDGYAVRATDTFGSSESIPAILPVAGEVSMGEAALTALKPGSCMSVPTGGDVPENADAVVMLEYTENYGDGTVGVTKPVAPGENLIFKGDDAAPGDVLVKAGHRLSPHDIGALAALGISRISVCRSPCVGIISTGDELIDSADTPRKGQIRDVNSSLLSALVTEAGGLPVRYGILKDDEDLLNTTVQKAARECDMVLISGGSSVGMKDATARVIERNGAVLCHGIAMKPGKPTIFGTVGTTPVFGLPGHPVAAYFVSHLFVRAMLARLLNTAVITHTITASLATAVSSNHGREEFIGVRLERSEDIPSAHPLHGKSGLIVALTGSHGYMRISRDCEGLSKGAMIQVTPLAVEYKRGDL